MAKHYLVASLIAAGFSAIYEHFSHGVYSIFMVGLALWPLVLGVLPCWLAHLSGAQDPSPVTRTLLVCGVLTLTMGSVVAGVMEIYGSTSAFTPVFWFTGIVIMLAMLFERALSTKQAVTS